MSIVIRSSLGPLFCPGRPMPGLTHCAAGTAIGCLEARCWASHFSLIARVASSIFMLGSRLAPDHHLQCPWHVRGHVIASSLARQNQGERECSTRASGRCGMAKGRTSGSKRGKPQTRRAPTRLSHCEWSTIWNGSLSIGLASSRNFSAARGLFAS
jgi:hypothetical protein